MGYCAVPASSATICRYAAMLARSHKYSSISQYLNVIRILHLEWGLPDPLKDNYPLSSLMKGIRRALASPVCRKKPITPNLLLHILSTLDVSQSLDSCIWAAALLMFGAMLRRSNVLPLSVQAFVPDKHLRRQDIVLYKDRLVITIRWSKTIQFKERSLTIPLFRIPNSPLCPVQAVAHAWRLCPGALADGPAFVFRSGITQATGAELRPLTAPVFLRAVRRGIVKSGADPSSFGTHSFRRGGASFAFQVGLSSDSIRLIGDWQSLSSYNIYVGHSTPSLRQAMARMATSLQNF